MMPSGASFIPPDVRRCASAAGCSSRERLGSRYVGKLLSTVVGLCDACFRRVEKAVRLLPADVGELDELIGATGSSAEAQVSFSRELQVPIRLGLEALRAEVDFESQFWAEILGMETLVAVRLPQRVSAACRWLEPRVGALVALGLQERVAWTQDGEPVRDAWGQRETELRDGLRGAVGLAQLHQRVRFVAGRTKLVHRLTPACPLCDQRALVRHNGSDRVECEGCEKQIEERHYDWFVQVTIAEERRRQLVA